MILNFNGEKYLKNCLGSVLDLDMKDKEVIFVDNASTDNSLSFVERNYPGISIIKNDKNEGYARGANIGIEKCKGDYVLIINPDIVFEPDYLKNLITRLHGDSKIGAIIGKLRKYDFEGKCKTNIMDSAGLEIYKNRRCVDRGQGAVDIGQFDSPEEVFGITGACPLYRKKALDDCQVEGEFFDGDFFTYKEDVDLSWRMRLMGWKCFYEPSAVAYHCRGTGVVLREKILEVAANRKNLSKFQKFYSYKNERLMRVKNDLAANVSANLLSIVWKEVLMTGWMTFREPFLYKAFFAFIKQLPSALRKRKEISRRKKVSAKEMQKWFV